MALYSCHIPTHCTVRFISFQLDLCFFPNRKDNEDGVDIASQEALSPLEIGNKWGPCKRGHWVHSRGQNWPGKVFPMVIIRVIWVRNKTVLDIVCFQWNFFYCFIVLTPFSLFLFLMMSQWKLSAMVAERNCSLSQMSDAQPTNMVFRSLEGFQCLCCYPT